MTIIMKPNASEKTARKVARIIESKEFQVHPSKGPQVTVIDVVGDKIGLQGSDIETSEGVDEAVTITESYKLTNKKFHPEDSTVPVDNTHIGPGTMAVMAGPCAIESKEQLIETAFAIKEAGATFLRGGVYKPRISPYSFRGLEEERPKYIKEVREATGLNAIREATSLHAIEAASRYVDMLQTGVGNMQNFELLREAGKSGVPILLKRGLRVTIDEWPNATEYIISGGNPNIVLCEGGIRTYETFTRNTLDISAVPMIRQKSHLPIIMDPSHAAGVRAHVEPLAKAPIVVGTDGLMTEIYPCPSKALSDGSQSLTFPASEQLMADLKPYADLIGHTSGVKQTGLEHSGT